MDLNELIKIDKILDIYYKFHEFTINDGKRHCELNINNINSCSVRQRTNNYASNIGVFRTPSMNAIDNVFKGCVN